MGNSTETEELVPELVPLAGSMETPVNVPVVKNLAPSKTLGNTNVNQAIDNVRDIKFAGDRDAFKLLSKAWSDAEGWMMSTKAMSLTRRQAF